MRTFKIKPKQRFFDKPENQRAMLIALIAALVVLAADMVKTVVGWIFLLLGSNNAWLGQFLGFAGAKR